MSSARWQRWARPGGVVRELEADQLAAIKGRFVLSMNDTPLAREVFGCFHMEEVPVTYPVGTAYGRGQRSGELIVQN